VADPPSNLGFEDPGGAPGTASAWLLLEAPQAREFAAFSTRAHAPASDPYFTGWSPVGCALPYALAPTPYGVPVSAVQIADDGSTGMHGAESPDAVELLPGRTYTASVYAYGTVGALAALHVQVSAGGALVAVLDTSQRRATCAARVGASPPDETVISHLSAGAHRVAGNVWTRLWLSFTVAEGATEPGLAAATVRVLSAADDEGGVEYAGPAAESPAVWGFSLVEEPLSAAEAFAGGWDNEGYAAELDGEVYALFPSEDPGGSPRDGFDRWVVPFLWDLSGHAITAAWTGPSATEEGFGGGWDNDGYLTALASPTVALWGGSEPAEGFEEGWLNDSYETVLSGAVAAAFSADLADAAETFERAYGDAEYTADPATDRLAVTAQPYAAGVRVRVVNDGGVPGAAFPAPLTAQGFYFVVNPNPTYLQLSLTFGGGAVDLTSAGSGTQTVRADARRYWPGPDHNPTL
jgi:hypothetical protein